MLQKLFKKYSPESSYLERKTQFILNQKISACFVMKKVAHTVPSFIWSTTAYLAMWPDLAIFWTLGKFLKPLTTINSPKSPTFLGNFCKGFKIFHFSSEIIFGQLL